MLETEKFHQRPFPYSILNILKICSVSVMEFFDKLSRWIDIATSSKRIQEHSLKIQVSENLFLCGVLFFLCLRLGPYYVLLNTPNQREEDGRSLSSSTFMRTGTLWKCAAFVPIIFMSNASLFAKNREHS
ncbi:hypothetical protein ANCCAN_29833 [Ancylostoma caninum]|uniref:Uncharacterized protein n=1 Tax=Ancylostoma caninum TaxID=29170 RepID=A0A368F0F0_ANCCA|nr:hypothetical protein ANCCAN_29833 [Ancylostoma caninum]